MRLWQRQLWRVLIKVNCLWETTGHFLPLPHRLMGLQLLPCNFRRLALFLEPLMSVFG